MLHKFAALAVFSGVREEIISDPYAWHSTTDEDARRILEECLSGAWGVRDENALWKYFQDRKYLRISECHG